MRKKFFTFIFLFSVLFGSLNILAVSASQDAPMNAPNTLDQAKEQGKDILWGIPDQMKGLFTQVKDKAISIWDQWVYSRIKSVWDRIVLFFQNNLGVSKPAIENKFEQEKKDIKQEAPVVGKSLWQKFMDLIK